MIHRTKGETWYEKHTVIETNGRSTECDVKEVNAIEIPDNATNGDIIKALFPNTDIYISPYRDRVAICTKKEYLYVDKDWWNTPYRKEGEEE